MKATKPVKNFVKKVKIGNDCVGNASLEHPSLLVMLVKKNAYWIPILHLRDSTCEIF